MIYIWKCRSCGHQYDVFSSVAKRDEPVPCPDCGSGETGRVEIPEGFGLTLNTEGGYEMAAWEKGKPDRLIPGHFGKEARRGSSKGTSKWL